MTTVRWTCPNYDREFGRMRQSHVCVPGCTVDETFEGRAPGQREAYDAIVGFLQTLGEVHEDAVRVGVFLKAGRTLAEARPMVRSLKLYLFLSRRVDDARLYGVQPIAEGRFMHTLRLHGPEDVDDQLRDWLAEALGAADD